jgi:hypothetical protein
MRIRTPYVMLVASVVVGAVVVPALAQDLPETSITSTARATPSKAGTPKHPQGVAITALAHLIVPPDLDPPIVTRIEILSGPGLKWNGEKYAKCTKQALERHGPSGCPATSRIGSATATGMADTAPARLDVIFFNAAHGRKYAYATLNNPARVRETLTVEASDLKGGGTWAHRETVSIPKSLQIVAGVPVRLTRVELKIGGKPYAKDFITTTSCPAGGWKYQVTADYLYDTLDRTSNDVNRGAIACTK